MADLMDVVRIDDETSTTVGNTQKEIAPTILEAAPGTIEVKLHPLVIINISDHYTRIRAQHDGKISPTGVIGAILGVQNGRQVEVFNSFELLFTVADGVATIDNEYLDQKAAQFKEVFESLDLLGWYTTGSEVTAAHTEVHKQMLCMNDSPLFLLLDPVPHPSERDLPLKLFESAIEIVDDAQRLSFIPAGFTLASEEAERIGVDHVAKITSSAGTSTSSTATAASEAALHLGTQCGAIDMLRQRIVIVRDYLSAVDAGRLPQNHRVLRAVASLCTRLPISSHTSGADTAAPFLETANDAMLISYLASVTKGYGALVEMLDKFPIVYDRPSRRGRTFFLS
eukprot:m.632127 g.632127  ORF g.632127 m.632127 type:complete len:340 (-) comp22577_c0_seq3:4055-5074(-)